MQQINNNVPMSYRNSQWNKIINLMMKICVKFNKFNHLKNNKLMILLQFLMIKLKNSMKINSKVRKANNSWVNRYFSSLKLLIMQISLLKWNKNSEDIKNHQLISCFLTNNKINLNKNNLRRNKCY
jgi:hypothetical protein